MERENMYTIMINLPAIVSSAKDEWFRNGQDYNADRFKTDEEGIQYLFLSNLECNFCASVNNILKENLYPNTFIDKNGIISLRHRTGDKEVIEVRWLSMEDAIQLLLIDKRETEQTRFAARIIRTIRNRCAEFSNIYGLKFNFYNFDFSMKI